MREIPVAALKFCNAVSFFVKIRPFVGMKINFADIRARRIDYDFFATKAIDFTGIIVSIRATQLMK